MMRSWRRLALAAALCLTVGAGAAAAQTVIVMNAPPKAPVEVVLNLAKIASGTTDAGGDATLTFNLQEALRKPEADVSIHVEACGTLRRVYLAERGVQPPAAEAGCDRREIAGLFVLRPVTHMVVDLVSARPAVWVKQGAVPKEWLLKGADAESLPHTWRPAPVGIVLFGGGGLVSLSEAGSNACGNVTDCTSDATRRAFTAGADWWITRYLAAEASYLKPSPATGEGSGTDFRFDSELDVELFTLAAKLGVPVGPVRIYGKIGAAYHRATWTGSQTMDETTVTVDGETVTIPGGTQTFELKTRGWGLTYGGGLEAWLKPWFALYGEIDRTKVKGPAEGDDTLELKDTAMSFVGGIRIHIGK